MALVYCRECGKQISDEAVACPTCGKPAKQAPARIASPKSKSTAVVLAVFLGGIGAHKFYLGKNGMGIVYVLFCWTFIPAFIGLLEGISYATTDEETFQKKYVVA